jgi:hypothetical protein
MTEEWSEFKSRILLISRCKLEGVFVTKTSNISGFLWGDDGQ